MKKIFLLILTALAFASCTLYMDEPEDDKKGKDDNIENGDGFSAPRTDVTADGTTTYQFNPTTKVFDETNSQYVLNAEDSVVWLSTSTPYEMIPRVGDAIYSNFTETFPKAMMGKVASVTKENGMIKCVCTSTTVGHVFKVFDVHYSIPLSNYFDSSMVDKSLAEKVKEARQRTRGQAIIPFVFSSNIDTSVQGEFFKRKCVTGSIKGSLSAGFTMIKYIKVDFDFSLTKEMIRFVITDSTIVDHNYMFALTGEVTATLLAFDKNPISEKALKVIHESVEVPIVSTPFVVFVDPKLEFSMSGSGELDFTKHEYSLKKWGVEKTLGQDAKIINISDEDVTPRYKNVNGEFSAELDFIYRMGIALGPLKDYASAAASLKIGPKFIFTGGKSKIKDAEWTGDGDNYYIDKPITCEIGMFVKAGFDIRVQWDEKKPFIKLDPTIVNIYAPFKTWYLTPVLTNFTITPLESVVSGMQKERYRIEAHVVEAESVKDFSPSVFIFNNYDKFIMEVPLTKVRNHNGQVIYRSDFELDTQKHETYYGQVYYMNENERCIFSDEIPFGVKMYIGLEQCRQVEGTKDATAKKPYNFEARGKLRVAGSSKVSQWGIRFQLYNTSGRSVSKSQCVYFDPLDGVKSWGLKISSKKKGPYVLKIEPIYKTGYGTSTKVNVVEDKIVELPLDPDFGECQETEDYWQKPDVYVNLTDKK